MSGSALSEEAEFIGHGPCDDCGSSDALARYSDGHTYCFACETHTAGERANVTQRTAKRTPGGFLSCAAQQLNKRKLSAKTLAKWGYGVTEDGRHVAQYYDDRGNVVAQKVRTPDKKFSIIGDAKAMRLYGQWLWSPGGRNLVITEGELDALSMSQVQDLKWPVVSVPNGAQSAAKAVAAQIDYVESFKRVVIMFDGDQPGREAAEEVAQLLTPGKACIARWPEGIKDASDALQQGQTAALESAFWQAPVYRPDGIMGVREIEERINNSAALAPLGKPLTEGLFEKTRYLVPGQVWMICSGSGMGKTEFVREFAYSLVEQGLRVGHVGLEEGVERSLVGFAGLHLNERLDLWEQQAEDGSFLPPTRHPKWEETMQYYEDRLFCYDDWGSVGTGNLLNKIRYLRVALKCDIIVLDHLSILVSDLEEEDERKTIDRVMTRIRSFSEETGVVVICVSHLKRPQGTPHEEGGRTTLAQLRGSAAIGQLSDICIGLERNQQADDETANITTVRVLKNRRTGRVGVAGTMEYDHQTGRMIPADEPSFSTATATVTRRPDY